MRHLGACIFIITSVLIASHTCMAQDLEPGVDYFENPELSELQPVLINNTLLANLLALAERIDLKESFPSDSVRNRISLSAFLYVLGDEAEPSCIPEAHGSCRRHYYLALASYELPQRSVVYSLGYVGELGDFVWLNSDQRTEAHLQFTAFRYPRWALESNPALASGQQCQRFEVWISVEGIRIKRIE